MITLSTISVIAVKYCTLNVAGCHNITDTGLMFVSFNLTLLNVAHCYFQFQTIVHTLQECDVQVLCTQGMRTAWEERIRLFSLFPSLEIGIPNIWVFFDQLPGFSPKSILLV